MNPADLGLPPRYVAWRRNQEDAVFAAACADERFVGLVAPTGFGKSIVYIAAALLSGWRVCVLTATKALETQLINDLESAGLFDIRGRNNYECRLDIEHHDLWKKRRDHALRVDEGACNWGQFCAYKQRGCEYFDDYRKALRSKLVVTNYAYWMAINAYGDGLGKFDMIVCDEAHDAPDQLGSFLSTFVTWKEITDYGLEDPPEEPDDWAAWARPHSLRLLAGAVTMAEGLGVMPAGRRTMLREIKHQEELGRRLSTVSSFKGQWIMDRDDRGFTWDPLWPGPYAEEFLFLGVPHVLLVSATLRAKTMALLGVPSDASCLLEYPSSFPVARRPIIHVPTVRLSAGSNFLDLKRWVSRIDELLDKRGDRKGIIHTVSYDRRDFLLQNSRHRPRMISHTKRDLAAVVKEFKASKSPLVLVSPSVTTGYDFPYRQCEFIIISKIPYPSLGSKVVQARRQADRHWYAYATAQEVEQEAGRGMRHADDRCEVIIVDDAFKYLWYDRGRLFTRAFKEAVRFSKVVPVPPPALPRAY